MSEPAGTTSFGFDLGTGRVPLTPSQTVGPYLAIGLTWADGEDVVPEGTEGAVFIGGLLTDGTGTPIPDGLVETWQADPGGRFDHPDDPRGAVRPDTTGFRGFGRSQTVNGGHWQVRTVKPGPVPTPDGGTEAPHLDVSVFARGMLDRTVTRIYFPEDGEAHATDPVLQAVDPARRHTLIATKVDGGYRFDIRLQGEDETVFFDL
jgi:protocatechuate 3,4-dioxygenase alpha subunit